MPLFLFLLLLLSIPSCSQPPKKLDASYDIGKDLILLQTEVNGWYHSKQRTNENEIRPYGYHGIYWNPKDHSYYYAHGDGTNLYITNGLSYKIDPSKQETNDFADETEYIEYAGSISPLERLYIDKKDGTQYIKRLRVIKDPFPVYPNFIPGHIVSYTNAEGKRFARDPGSYTITNENVMLLQAF